MDSSHYQIHSDRVVNTQNIKPEFLACNICRNILWQPEKCKECQTHFCRFCIVFSHLKSKKCPNCLLEYQSKSPDSFLREDLMDLKVKCYYTYNGCNKILKYDSILKHESDCIYREQNCEECNNKILKKNYHTHIIICKNSLPENMLIDFKQILIYFQDKLECIDKENLNDLEKVKKNFIDSYNQKELVLQNLILKMEKQRKTLEEILLEIEKKKKNMSEEEMKIFNNFSSNLSPTHFIKHKNNNTFVNKQIVAQNLNNLNNLNDNKSNNEIINTLSPLNRIIQ